MLLKPLERGRDRSSISDPYADPLHEVTRRERRAMLVSAGSLIVIKYTGLLPSRITTLGIEFTPADQAALLVILALITSFLCVGFVVYAIGDLARFLAIVRTEEALREISWAHATGGRTRKPTFFLTPRVRALFDFVLPVLVAVYAVGITMIDALAS